MSYHIVSPKINPEKPPHIVLGGNGAFKQWKEATGSLDDVRTDHETFEIAVPEIVKPWGEGARLIVDMHPPKEGRKYPNRIWLCEPDRIYGVTYLKDSSSQSAVRSKDWTILMIRMLEVKAITDITAISEKERMEEHNQVVRRKRSEAFKDLMGEREHSQHPNIFYEFLYYTHDDAGQWKSASPGSNNVAALYPDALRYFLPILNDDEDLHRK